GIGLATSEGHAPCRVACAVEPSEPQRALARAVRQRTRAEVDAAAVLTDGDKPAGAIRGDAGDGVHLCPAKTVAPDVIALDGQPCDDDVPAARARQYAAAEVDRLRRIFRAEGRPEEDAAVFCARE